MSKYDAVVNQKNGLSVKNSPGCHCKVTGIVYAIHCKKCKLLYTRETGETMFDRYSGHKYDIKKRPDNCDLAKHCRSSNHDLEKDLEITIIEHGMKKNRTDAG